jgi:hypothetical protein
MPQVCSSPEHILNANLHSVYKRLVETISDTTSYKKGPDIDFAQMDIIQLCGMQY